MYACLCGLGRDWDGSVLTFIVTFSMLFVVALCPGGNPPMAMQYPPPPGVNQPPPPGSMAPAPWQMSRFMCRVFGERSTFLRLRLCKDGDAETLCLLLN